MDNNNDVGDHSDSAVGYPFAFGVIVVFDRGISVRRQQLDGITETTYTEATFENLRDAARVLAKWMDLKFENVKDECNRVHDGDQFDAFLRETIDRAFEDLDR